MTLPSPAPMPGATIAAAALDDPAAIRRAGAAVLGRALVDSRARTLQTFDDYARALGDAAMQVPYSPELNPPVWELGHVGWFQEYWMARNPQRRQGIAASDAGPPRGPSILADADRCFDSGRVEHRSRWHLPLPATDRIRGYLAQTLDDSLRLLEAERAGDGADPLHAARYFAWLSLVHEDMHHEAAQYMAQALAIGLAQGPRPPAAGAAPPGAELGFAAGPCARGLDGTGFAFDNELPGDRPLLEAYRIDAAPVGNAAFAAFVAAGGYADPQYWSAAGWQWRIQAGATAPRYWRAHGSGWQQRWFGQWIALDPAAPVVHVTAHEADAWCRWAGRRLPAELEWENAALRAGPDTFAWGQVWEWTASAFRPFPGFVAHPYRDYSQPWFETRRVLRGGSVATHARLRHPCYRNFYPPGRNDIFAGFRSCPVA